MSKVIELYVVHASDVLNSDGIEMLGERSPWTYGDCDYSLASREQFLLWLQRLDEPVDAYITPFGKDVLYHYAHTHTYIALDK